MDFPFVDELAEPLTFKLPQYRYSVTDHVLGSPMRAPQYNRAACLISGLILLCQLPLLAIADELTPNERAIAASLAETAAWSSHASTTAPRSNKGDHETTHPLREHPLGTQTLSIEADWKKHADGSRLARIYQYDYARLKSRLLVINVNTEQVIHKQLIDSVHLPLSPDEIRYATALLNTSARLLRNINQERSRQSLEPLTDLSVFDVKASIYEPTLNNHPCSTERCVLFALVDATLTVSSVEPIVLLGNGDVQLLQDTLR